MSVITPLQQLLAAYRTAAVSEREKGTYFEELIRTYLRHEPTYADLYSDVWLLEEVPEKYGISRRDVGIDLVALTRGTGELHAVQCKSYGADHRIMKSDIDSFFTASGQKPFTHRVIITATNQWSENAEAALFDQQPPVSRIDLNDLETSQIDWAKYKPNAEPELKPKIPTATASTNRHWPRHRRAENRRPGQTDHGLRNREDLRLAENCRTNCRRGQARAVPGRHRHVHHAADAKRPDHARTTAALLHRGDQHRSGLP